MKRSAIYLAATMMLAVGAVDTANAAVVIGGAADKGKTYSLDFAGQIGGNAEPRVSSTLDLTFADLSADGKTYSFTYSFTNTSEIEARLRSFGFNVIGGNVIQASASGAFRSFTIRDNFPEGIGKLDLCFKTTQSGSCTGGNGGLIPGQTGTGAFSFTLAAPANSIALDDITARFQSINGGGYREASGIGIGVQAAVPEPSTWLMLILGFAAIGGMMRRQPGQNLRVRFT